MLWSHPLLLPPRPLEGDGVLDFLGLELPAGRQIVVRHRRLADALNAQWIDRYRLQELKRREPS